MKERRIKYWLYVAALISVAMLTVIASGFGVSHGRINNVLSWNTVYSTASGELDSNYLAEGGQTVLLEKWETEQGETIRTETITLSTTKGMLEGTLTCSTTSGVISASVDKTYVTADENSESVVLTIALNDSALSLTRITEVSVYVGWVPADSADGKATHSADFRIEICPPDAEQASDDASVGLKSNYLVSGGNIVLFNDWQATAVSTYRTQNIEFTTKIGEITGTLSCETDSEYLTASIDNSEDPLRITVGDTSKYVSVLKTTLLKEAETITEKTKATVRVSWTPDSAPDGKPTMWTDFVVNIIPADSTSGNIDEGANTAQLDLTGVPSLFDFSSFFKITVKCPDNTDMIKIGYGGEVFPIGTAFSYDGITNYVLGESMMISVDASGKSSVDIWLNLSDISEEQIDAVILSFSAYSNGTVIAAGEKELTPYYESNESFEMLGDGCVPTEISSSEAMLLQIRLPSDSTSLKLSCNGKAFPEGTRYRFDGRSYVMSCRNEEIEISTNGRSSINLYIDFSKVTENIPEQLTIKISAYEGVYELSSDEAQCATTLAPLGAIYELSQMIIHYNSSVSLNISGENEQTVLKVQRFSSVNGQMAYVEDENNFGLTVKTENGVLSISNEAGKAEAGTYRIILAREQSGYELNRIEIPFFIHY